MITKTKIIFVITKGNFGGAQKYLLDLVSVMPKEHFEISVILGRGDLLVNKLEELGVKIIQIKELSRDVNIFNDFKVFLKLIKIFKSEKPDILHLNSSKIGGLGSLAGRVAKIPKIIFTAHGWAFKESRNKASRIVIKFLSWLTVIFCHKVITVSETNRLEIVNMPFTKHKVVTIRNGIKKINFLDKITARKEIVEIVNNPKLKENQIWIGTIAELHQNKGLEYSIKAIENLKNILDVKYIIFGEGELRRFLTSDIKNMGLENSVFLGGQLENAAKVLKAFDIFVLPSIKEGLPFVLLEAGLAGLPVISTTVGGIPEIIEDGHTGYLVNPKDPTAIKNDIVEILNKPEKAEKNSQNLKIKIENEFSLSRSYEETLKIYR